MAEPRTELQIPLDPQEAFKVYVEQMNTWWPRQGIFPYSFAPSTTKPDRIEFEAEAGGRYFETFADGSELEVGRITSWNPPHHLAYTWRDPEWPGETTITVSFTASEDGTLVAYEHVGFADAGVPELAPYYVIGNRQTLAGYEAHCRAIAELRALQTP